MTEIEFRGFCPDLDEWEFGFYAEIEGKHYIHYGDFEMHEVLPETVGQYIGCPDRYGVKIYGAIGEKGGDLLQVANRHIYEVVYSTADGDGEMIAGFCLRNQSQNALFLIDQYAIKNGKILGNAYNTPELIE